MIAMRASSARVLRCFSRVARINLAGEVRQVDADDHDDKRQPQPGQEGDEGGQDRRDIAVQPIRSETARVANTMITNRTR